MATHVRCKHGLLRACFACEMAEPGRLSRIDDWMDRHDKGITRLMAVFVFVTFVYLAGSVALR